MTGTKPKHLPTVMESIVQLLQVWEISLKHQRFFFLKNQHFIFIKDEESSIQKLNLSDCKLRTEINNVINALVRLFVFY